MFATTSIIACPPLKSALLAKQIMLMWRLRNRKQQILWDLKTVKTNLTRMVLLPHGKILLNIMISY